MVSPMGRRRQDRLDLPPRMQFKHGAYYYVTNTTPRKWIRLGNELSKARILWAEMENAGVETEPRVNDLIDRWLASPAFEELATNTQRLYSGVSRQLVKFFEGARVSDVTPATIAAWLDNHSSKCMANQGKAVLTNVYNVAVRQGLCDRNPCKEVKDLPIPKRDRYITDAEYLAIREHADTTLRVAMDISYITGARISDVTKIKLADIAPEGLLIVQKKTGKKQMFHMTPALKEALDAARTLPRSVRGLVYLICTRSGQQYKPETFRNWWQPACVAAGVENAHFHDIRAKAATDAKKLGMDYQKLLGHTSKAMSDRYIRLREAEEISPLPMKVSAKL